MNLLFVIKPYDIEVYSEESSQRTLLGIEAIEKIENEDPKDYEGRMLFVCKNLAQDAKKHVKNIHDVSVFLCYPWCTYDHVDVKKVFETETAITPKLVDSLKLQKLNGGIILLESEVSHILLNGYSIQDPYKHKAKEIEMQVLNIYAKESFLNPLKKTVESVFHTHNVQVSSLYAYALTRPRNNGLIITLEEESIDISYTAEGKVLLNVFIPQSYVFLEQGLTGILDADQKTVRDILVSRNLSVNPAQAEEGQPRKAGKNMRHIWPDLHQNIQGQVDKALNDHYDIILKYIYTLIEQIQNERTFSKEEIHIYTLNQKLAAVYGYGLAKVLADNEYIQNKLRISSADVYIDYLF